jgi:hypothetical protein
MHCKQGRLALHETGGVKAAIASATTAKNTWRYCRRPRVSALALRKNLSELTGPKEPEM